MKRSSRIFCAAMCCLFAFVLLQACNSGSYQLQVTQNFDPEIEQQQNLEFSFNKDLLPDSLLNRWDSTAYLEIEPKVRGLFKWNSTNALTFSPESGFQPGTEYTARLTDKILMHSKKKYSMDKGPIHFHTAPLKVASAHVSWTRGKNVANVVVQLDMSFNYDINLSELANRLKLSSGGNGININAVNSGNGKVLSVQFMPVNDKDEETPLKIEISKGVPVTNSKYISEKDTAFAMDIPSRYNLAITGVSGQHTGTEGVVTVSTSQPVLENNIKSMISFEPAVPFDIVINEAGFTITGAQFSATQQYTMRVSTGLEGAFGGRMKSEYSAQVVFGELKPAITFANTNGMYLSSAGYRNVQLNIVNVPSIDVIVIKVYENNIEQFMRDGTDYGYSYDEDEERGHGYDYFDTRNLGDTVFKRSYETSKLPRQSAASILHLDFEDKIKDFNGIYVVQVRSKEQNWVQESKIISISDMGLIVKEERDNIYVFANSIKTTAPITDAKISFISSTNQKIYTASTDAEGVAVFKNISATAPGFNVAMITARRGDEFSFVLFGKTHIGTSRFDVGGRRPNDAGLIAMVYPERNLYRPGETINISTIVRREQWDNETDVPVKIKLIMPNGKEFSSVRKILNEQGSCEASFTPPHTAMTGTYIVQVFTGNDVLLNTYDISVEDFMPDRMKVSLKLDKEEYKPGENINAGIQADNLFGTPAAGRNYQCELNISKGEFSSDKFSDFDFAMKNDFKFNTDNREDKTDEKGSGTEKFELNSEMANAGILDGNVMATVFDETGRPVHRYASFKVYTQPAFAGIRCRDDYVSSRKPVTMGLIALDKNSVPQGVDVEVVLVAVEWHTVIQSSGYSYRYVSQSSDRLISRQTKHVEGTNTTYTFVPNESGQYEVRVFMKGSNNYVAKTVYAYGWGDTKYTSFEVSNEGNVEIKTDKADYNAGDNVNVLFTTPFEGKLLVTLERDHMLKHYYLETKNKSASLSLKAGEEHLPNIYVAATLIRPMGGDDMPLTVAHGFRSVKVSKKEYELPVKIVAVEKSRSQTKQTITVKTVPNAYVTVAAVDEGILQVKDFETPDPYKYFYQKVALMVNSYDIYPWLLPEIKSTVSTTGGDGSDDGSSRVNPMFVNRVKNVSFWSGIRQADGSGTLKYDIDIPQFSGDIRIMALAYKNKSFGSAEQHMKVADPVIISTALPRFLSPGDEVVMPVTLTNTTEKNVTAIVTVKSAGQVDIKEGQTQSIQIPANREMRVVYNVTALPAIGAGNVTVTVKAFNETFTNTTDIGVRPPASLQKVTGSGFADAGHPAVVDLKNSFIPTSVRGKVTVSKSPLTQFSKHLDDLVHYPYGCVEQTTSAAFPQLYYADLVKSLDGANTQGGNPAYNVQQAINKLQSMQLGNGALSYWPGGNYESWWGSVYACHFLYEARKAGFEVNARTIDRLQEYMKFMLYKKETFTYYYDGGKHREAAPEEIPYSLYVLALQGHPDQSTMNYYKAHSDQLTLDGRYMLAAAYAMSGQPLQSKQLLPPAFSGEKPDRAFGGSFYSHIRDLAISLNVMIDMDPGNKQVGIMAQQLSAALLQERYPNTQENAFSILALGKLARMANKTNATAAVTVSGKTVASSSGQPAAVDVRPYAGSAMNIKVSGTGGFYYFWEISGISADGSYKQEDSYMQVRRTFFSRSGAQLGNTFRQNDLIVVRISVEGQYQHDIENVAITDMLPAGFEIENTRLKEMPKMEWMGDDADQPDYMDMRDDRMNMFTTVTHTRKDFYYMVRAVSPGTYQLGPVQADAMYNGNYHSYHGAGIVKITEN